MHHRLFVRSAAPSVSGHSHQLIVELGDEGDGLRQARGIGAIWGGVSNGNR